jgi:hypothetical protein
VHDQHAPPEQGHTLTHPRLEELHQWAIDHEAAQRLGDPDLIRDVGTEFAAVRMRVERDLGKRLRLEVTADDADLPNAAAIRRRLNAATTRRARRRLRAQRRHTRELVNLVRRAQRSTSRLVGYERGAARELASLKQQRPHSTSGRRCRERRPTCRRVRRAACRSSASSGDSPPGEPEPPADADRGHRAGVVA